MDDVEWLRRRRLLELEKVVDLIRQHHPDAKNVMELGAGSGIQSELLSKAGFDVEAIDVSGSEHRENQVWPVTVYNGKDIPFPSGSFDVVFSSSVLEHIPHMDAIESEITRVLRPSGIAVHVVPSSVWRFWTYWTHYPYVARFATRLILTKVAGANRKPPAVTPKKVRHSPTTSPRHSFRSIVFSERHGEHGNAITELFFFSRSSWKAHFLRNRFQIQEITTNELFYTGYASLGPMLNLSVRKTLSRILGASHTIFVLRPSSAETDQPVQAKAD